MRIILIASMALMAVLMPAGGSVVGQQSPHGKLSIACLDCHSTDSWTMRADAKFSHESTGFPLVGQHRFLECRSCHKDLKFAGTEKNCLSCHTDVHNSELGSDCLRCHAMTSWVVADMRQKHQETRFPLVGRHLDADCESCHSREIPRRFAAASPECISCHRGEYTATMEPSHAVSGFAVACADCHKVTAPEWKGSFDHDLTAFPLTGAHKAVICSECHANNRFGKLPTECFSCHETHFAAALSPNHVSGGFSHGCLSCHTTAAWRPATFDHNLTGFPLTGKHLQSACQDCHVGGNYQLIYTDCYQCHQADYALAVNPNHAANNYDHNCAACHTTGGWSPASFDHASTAFPLTGRHVNVSCGSCHINNNYQLAYTNCYQCHQPEYESVSNPDHVANNYDHDCAACHTTSAWTPASFNHSTTNFALTGSHTSITCASCHVGNNYQLTYTDCYACHQAEFTSVADPDHVTPGFAHDCASCHTTTAWTPSTFDHDGQYFRIYSGKHSGKWVSCADCHDAPADYGVFTCISCHEHNQAEADGHHGNVTDYIYSRTSCYTCHPGV